MQRIRIAATVLACLVMAAAVIAALILLTPLGAAGVVNGACARVLGPGNVVYERLEGSLLRGLRVFNMEVRRPWILRTGSVVRVQELHMRLAQVSLIGLEVSVINARIMDPKADPVVINGALSNGRYEANIYSKSLDLGALRQVIRQFRNPPPLAGEIKDIDLYLSGTFARPELKGTFVVAQIPRNVFVLKDAPVRCELFFTRAGGLWETHGRMFVSAGQLQAPGVMVTLAESALVFSGDPRDPELDIQASAMVDHVPIAIAVKGTRKEPQARLSSDPALPEEQLMLMLTTGKRWDGVDASLVARKMTPELAGDFVDYFFFGGSGLRVAKLLGLSSITYKLDAQKQGVMFNKDISERLDVGYGLAVTTPDPQRPREITQTVESEYRVTRKVTVGAQKEVLSSMAVNNGTAARPIPDDRVFLKFKTDF